VRTAELTDRAVSSEKKYLNIKLLYYIAFGGAVLALIMVIVLASQLFWNFFVNSIHKDCGYVVVDGGIYRQCRPITKEVLLSVFLLIILPLSIWFFAKLMSTRLDVSLNNIKISGGSKQEVISWHDVEGVRVFESGYRGMNNSHFVFKTSQKNVQVVVLCDLAYHKDLLKAILEVIHLRNLNIIVEGSISRIKLGEAPYGIFVEE
jgi:hypothetical protein